MSFIQCDDFLSAQEADSIEQLFLSNRFPWFYYGNVNYLEAPPAGVPGIYGADERFEDSHGFSFVLFPGNEPSTPWMRSATSILAKFSQRHGFTPEMLVRIKANLLVRSAKPGGPKPFVPHVDLPKPHWVVIYYVNDSDGDTLLLDKTYPDWQDARIVRSVSPKKGRAILFDGRHYHAGTPPHAHDVRVVLNYNITLKQPPS
ncbi:MAG: 2OG-Fe(II) oxygenase [Pirellulales bacterium]